MKKENYKAFRQQVLDELTGLAEDLEKEAEFSNDRSNTSVLQTTRRYYLGAGATASSSAAKIRMLILKLIVNS